MLTLIMPAGGKTSILQPELPEISLKDVPSCQSKRFAVVGLSVSIYNLPTCGCTTHQEDCYFLIYRPQGQKGSNLPTVLPPGLPLPGRVHATFLRGTATVLDGKVTR